jgi:hypothetical protein
MPNYVRKMIRSQNSFIQKHGGLKNYTISTKLVYFVCNDGEEFNCDIIEFSE